MISDDLGRIAEIDREIKAHEDEIRDLKGFVDDLGTEKGILERRVSNASILPPAEVERLLRTAP